MNNLIFHTDIFNIGNKPNKNVLLNTDQGMMIVNRFDKNESNVGHSQWLLDHGNCNTVEVNDCIQAIKHINEPIVFDVGANIGTISIWLSKILKNGHIYSFEPQKQIYYQLCGNIALNNLYNIDAYNLALGSTNDYLYVKEPNYFIDNDFGTFSLVEEKIEVNKKTLVVKMVTLDYFVKTYNISKIDLIKIDAEGMDLEVLKGATEVIEKYFPTIYIEHYDNQKSSLDAIKKFLSPFDYYFDLRKNNLLCQK